jgi:hypothetical protein
MCVALACVADAAMEDRIRGSGGERERVAFRAEPGCRWIWRLPAVIVRRWSVWRAARISWWLRAGAPRPSVTSQLCLSLGLGTQPPELRAHRARKGASARHELNAGFTNHQTRGRLPDRCVDVCSEPAVIESSSAGLVAAGAT